MLVEIFDGQILVNSKLDKGSTFTFTIKTLNRPHTPERLTSSILISNNDSPERSYIND